MHGNYNWIPANIRKEITVKSGGKCYWCSLKATRASINKRGIPVLFDKKGRIYHIDHKKTVKDGGKEKSDNLVLACHDCNLSKRKMKAANDSKVQRLLKNVNG